MEMMIGNIRVKISKWRIEIIIGILVLLHADKIIVDSGIRFYDFILFVCLLSLEIVQGVHVLCSQRVCMKLRMLLPEIITKIIEEWVSNRFV